MKRIVTFTNLFPSSAMPTHGLFVHERMRRVAAASGLDWLVVSPVPEVAWLLRHGSWRRWAAVPRDEVWAGVRVLHPRYRHWPGLSQRRQAAAMAAGARAAVAALAREGPIVLDAHYLWPDGVAAARLAQELGVPFLLTARGSDLNVIAADRPIAAQIRAAAERAAGCFAVSRALCERFAAVTGLPRERIVEVRNGVDLDRFRPGDRSAARAELGLPAAGRIVLGVGRLVPGKGFDLAVRALPTLPADVTLVLVGDGPERAALQAAGGARLRCLGALPPAGTAAAYRAADVLVLPSEREGWPNVVTEALASGLRVVATRVGGIPQILGDHEPVDPRLGALVPPRDGAALAAALAGVLATAPDPAFVRTFAMRYGWDEPVRFLASRCRALLGEEAA
ncbi:MAG: glycosyltransferase [Planctomycetes bacterium]|nr:glycosyltransferase [Planctomycetota bacterium]